MMNGIRARIFGRKGQATTEVVLLFPIFMIILFITTKIFALLVLVQKLEVASFYAARRWQLESHRNLAYTATWDDSFLKKDIEDKVKGYLGFSNQSVKGFLNLQDLQIDVVRTQVWNVVTIKLKTNPAGVRMLCVYPKAVVCSGYGEACTIGYNYLCVSGAKLEVIKYVPNRDRPIQFEIPGLN